ncbi:HAD family phosphatase [Candidatus Woesebacteria bacterium]|nr:HAD family phosphatase [Candidatus Woesebacteria bacterium]
MNLRAVIFDLNGTVLSDEQIYGFAFKRVLLSLGVKVDSDHPHTSGIGVAENWLQLIKKYNIKTQKTVDELSVITQQQYFSQMDEVELKDGFIEFADMLRESGLKIALATSNTWDITEKVLSKFDLLEYFDVITTKEEVHRNKPDPEIFFLTAEKLMIEPSECLVFEDSEKGIVAAKEAGMKVIGMTNGRNSKKMLKKADRIIEDFFEVTPTLLEQ